MSASKPFQKPDPSAVASSFDKARVEKFRCFMGSISSTRDPSNSIEEGTAIIDSLFEIYFCYQSQVAFLACDALGCSFDSLLFRTPDYFRGKPQILLPNPSSSSRVATSVASKDDSVRKETKVQTILRKKEATAMESRTKEFNARAAAVQYEHQRQHRFLELYTARQALVLSTPKPRDRRIAMLWVRRQLAAGLDPRIQPPKVSASDPELPSMLEDTIPDSHGKVLTAMQREEQLNSVALKALGDCVDAMKLRDGLTCSAPSPNNNFSTKELSLLEMDRESVPYHAKINSDNDEDNFVEIAATPSYPQIPILLNPKKFTNTVSSEQHLVHLEKLLQDRRDKLIRYGLLHVRAERYFLNPDVPECIGVPDHPQTTAESPLPLDFHTDYFSDIEMRSTWPFQQRKKMSVQTYSPLSSSHSRVSQVQERESFSMFPSLHRPFCLPSCSQSNSPSDCRLSRSNVSTNIQSKYEREMKIFTKNILNDFAQDAAVVLAENSRDCRAASSVQRLRVEKVKKNVQNMVRGQQTSNDPVASPALPTKSARTPRAPGRATAFVSRPEANYNSIVEKQNLVAYTQKEAKPRTFDENSTQFQANFGMAGRAIRQQRQTAAAITKKCLEQKKMNRALWRWRDTESHQQQAHINRLAKLEMARFQRELHEKQALLRCDIKREISLMKHRRQFKLPPQLVQYTDQQNLIQNVKASTCMNNEKQ